MKKPPAALLPAILLLGAPLSAQTISRARRAPLLGTFQAFVGEVGAYHPYRVTAPYAGRVESILVVPGQWVAKRDVLTLLASNELSALIDASGTTPENIQEKRWQDIYKPVQIFSPYDTGVVLSVLKTSRQKMSPGELILILAEAYTLETDIRPPASKHLSIGQKIEVWPPTKPKQRLEVRVIKVGKPGPGGASHVVFVLPQRLENIQTGDALEGKIFLNKPEPLLFVPLGALTTFQGRTFLTLEVQTGLNNGQEVEIVSGLDEARNFLLPAARRSPNPAKQKEAHE